MKNCFRKTSRKQKSVEEHITKKKNKQIRDTDRGGRNMLDENDQTKCIKKTKILPMFVSVCVCVVWVRAHQISNLCCILLLVLFPFCTF